MDFAQSISRTIPAGAIIVALASAMPVLAGGPETSIQTEYLMTAHAPLDAPQAIDQSLLVFNVQPGGWVEGPRIKGKLLAPGADFAVRCHAPRCARHDPDR